MMTPLQFGTRLHFVSPDRYREIYIQHHLGRSPEVKHPWTANEIIKTTDIGHTRFIDCCTAGYVRQPEESTTVFHLSIPAITDDLPEIEKRFQELKSPDTNTDTTNPFMIGASQEGRFIGSSYQAFGKIKCLLDSLFKKPFSFFFGHHPEKWYSDFCHFMEEDTTYISTYQYTGPTLTDHIDSPEKLKKVFAYSLVAPQDELWLNGKKVERLPVK